MSSCKVLEMQDSREMKAEVWQMLGSDIKSQDSANYFKARLDFRKRLGRYI